MPVPWLRIIDGVLGATDVVRWVRGTPASTDVAPRGAVGALETKLAGTVVAALKEVFDRDSERLEIERRQAEEARLRAERALRLELLRQAGEREIARLRMLTGVAVAGLAGTAILAARLGTHAPLARTLFAFGIVAFILALAGSLNGQAQVSKALGEGNDRVPADEVTRSPGGGAAVIAVLAAVLLVLAGVLFG